jgi:hypothetical protein
MNKEKSVLCCLGAIAENAPIHAGAFSQNLAPQAREEIRSTARHGNVHEVYL